MNISQIEFADRLEPILAAINDPDGPRMIAIEYDSTSMRNALIDDIVGELPDFQHVVLDLCRTKITSLTEAMREKLPEEVYQTETIEDVVYLVNLEVTFALEMWEGQTESEALASLLAEMKALTEEQPFVCLFWMSESLAARLQADVPDFWHAIPQHYELKVGNEAPAVTPSIDEQLASIREMEEGNDPQVIPAWIELGKSYATLNLPVREAATYAQAREWSTKLEDTTYLTSIYAAAGRLFYQLDYPKKAHELVNEALEYQEFAAENAAVGKALFLQGICLLQDEESEGIDEGLDLINRGLDILESEDDPLEAGKVNMTLARLYTQWGDLKSAREQYIRSLSNFKRADDTDRLGPIQQTLGLILEREGNLGRAVAYYGEAAKSFALTENDIAQAKSWQSIGDLEQGQRNWQASLTAFQKALPPAQATGDEMLIAAIEDSIENMQEKVDKQQTDKGEKKKGLFGKLFG